MFFLAANQNKAKTGITSSQSPNDIGAKNLKLGEKNKQSSENIKAASGDNIRVESYDLDKLAHAVAFAETRHCSDGTAIRRNNCFGIMTWTNGKRSPKYYKSQADSFNDFKRIWLKSYKVFPTLKEARKWTGNDNPTTWLNNVKFYYFKNSS